MRRPRWLFLTREQVALNVSRLLVALVVFLPAVGTANPIRTGHAVAVRQPSVVRDSANARARGIIRATVRTTISTELVAGISLLPVKAGESFARDDVLVVFDCARYEAEHRAAAAELETARLEVRANRKLLRHRAIGAIDVEISQARRKQMQARLDGLKVRERQCTIRAPFSGRVVTLPVQVHEMSTPGGPLIEIVNDTLEVELIVPSKWLVWLRIGARFAFDVDETQTRLNGDIKRIGAVVDPVSRTVRLIGSFGRQNTKIQPGMSGAATFHGGEG